MQIDDIGDAILHALGTLNEWIGGYTDIEPNDTRQDKVTVTKCNPLMGYLEIAVTSADPYYHEPGSTSLRTKRYRILIGAIEIEDESNSV